MSNQPIRQTAYLVAFRVKDGKLLMGTDTAPSELVFSQGNVHGLKINIPNKGEMFFPQESIEKLIAYDKNDPTSVRYITIRKHMIFKGYLEYAIRLKTRKQDLENEIVLVDSLRSALKTAMETDPAIPSLKKLYEENGGTY